MADQQTILEPTSEQQTDSIDDNTTTLPNSLRDYFPNPSPSPINQSFTEENEDRTDDHASCPSSDHASCPSSDHASFPSSDHTLSPSNDHTSFPHSDQDMTFTKLLTNLLPHDKIVSIRQDQAKMLQTLEMSNWKLSSLNEISESTFQKCSVDFRQTSKMLVDMKKQLDSIFRRIRHLKAQVAVNYPEAYAAVVAKYKEEYNEFDEEDEEDER